jgi:hypothetical protein
MFAASKTASVSGGYQISRSLRFNKDDSAYLNRSAASITNRNIWTWSAWVKRTNLSDFQYNLFGATYDANSYDEFRFNTSDKFRFFIVGGGAVTLDLITTQVFRDTSAWYHIIVAVDTTQATASNRAKIYVNGSQVTAFDTATYPSQNYGPVINFSPQNIGSSPSGFKLNAYMTEVNFIDGQALTPSSFGETNAQTGVWQPKAYSGSYGTNGFYLNFSDNSNTTAATLGKDYSGNGNNWTPNNFSVTAGAGNDSLVDSPTSYGTDTGVGGTVRGNYCTLSPTYAGATGITNGNLDVTLSGGTQYGTLSLTTGKWYWEVTPTASLSGSYLGVMSSAFIKTDATWDTTTTSTYVNNGNKYGIDGAVPYGATYTTGDVIGFALDLDAGTLVFYKNGTSQGTATSGMTGREWRPMLYASGGTYACNFGQRQFAYTAPSGFKALCTQNLPTPTIGATTATQAGKFFNPVLYTGDRTDRTITVGFQPDWVWVKSRSAADDHYLMNAVVGTGKYLSSNSSASETTNANTLTAYTSTGFSVGNTGTTNETGRTYVAWNWKANGSGSTNTSGSITSTVSANTTSGFSVVTYSGTSTAGTIGHGLGVAPSMIIVKNRNGSPSVPNWRVYHASLGATKYIELNSTGAAGTFTDWNNTAPTSTVFSVGADGTFFPNNQSGYNYVAYCFAEVAGYSKFTSWTGNGSVDGPFIFTGFRPAYVLVKQATGGGEGWWVFDNKRNAYNVTNSILSPNSSGAEITGDYGIDMVSNGFKIRNSQGFINSSGVTYICAAFAETPLKFSLAR